MKCIPRTALLALSLLASVACLAGEITVAANGVKTGGQFIVEYDTDSATPPEHAEPGGVSVKWRTTCTKPTA